MEEISRSELLKLHPEDQKRYWVAHLADGRQLHEFNCGWHQVPLHDIVMLELSVAGHKYVMEKRNMPPTFVEFVHFKTAIKKGLGGVDKGLTRSIGWHDGTNEYVIFVNERTGERIGGVEVGPVRHLHPQSKLLIRS